LEQKHFFKNSTKKTRYKKQEKKAEEARKVPKTRKNMEKTLNKYEKNKRTLG
jgi:hypothetical protein